MQEQYQLLILRQTNTNYMDYSSHAILTQINILVNVILTGPSPATHSYSQLAIGLVHFFFFFCVINHMMMDCSALLPAAFTTLDQSLPSLCTCFSQQKSHYLLALLLILQYHLSCPSLSLPSLCTCLLILLFILQSHLSHPPLSVSPRL